MKFFYVKNCSENLIQFFSFFFSQFFSGVFVLHKKKDRPPNRGRGNFSGDDRNFDRSGGGGGGGQRGDYNDRGGNQNRDGGERYNNFNRRGGGGQDRDRRDNNSHPNDRQPVTPSVTAIGK